MEPKRLRNSILTGMLTSLLLIATPDGDLAAQTKPAVDLRIAEEIVDREPVGVSDTFSAEVGQLAAWTRVTGAENTVIEHIWRYQDYEWVVPLDIGSPSWRTWSRKHILAEWTGQWEVEVRDPMGNTLTTQTFTVDAQ